MLRYLFWITSFATALVVLTPMIACAATNESERITIDPGKTWNPETKNVSDRLRRFYALGDLIEASYATNDLAAAGKLATEYLELAAEYRHNWNYGNAVHEANRFLGLICVKNGDFDGAAQYLLKAGKSTGSPQLDSFGPELDLANGLLQRGRVEPVRQYLQDIKKFWEMDHGQVERWLAGIEKGEKPELNRFAANQPNTTEQLLWGFVLGWPILAVLGTLYVLRKRISKKGLFCLTGLLCGYLGLFITYLSIIYFLPALMGKIGNDCALIACSMTFAALVRVMSVLCLLIPFLAIMGVSRLFLEHNDR